MSLSEVQAWLAEQLRSRRSLPAQPEVALEAARHLTGNDRLSPVEQLEVYREQFWLRHTASLIEDYPGVSGVLGQTDWEGLVESYLDSHLPTAWTLRELGREFPAHVERQTELAHHALCTDMARLEWAFIELFDAQEVPPLDLSKLAGLPPDSVQRGRIVLSPALRLLAVDYPVADLRSRLLRSRSTGETVPIPQPSPQRLVLYRAENRRLYHRPVGPEAFALLQALAGGSPLVAACERALEAVPDGAARLQANVGTWFRQWAERGWLVDVLPAEQDRPD